MLALVFLSAGTAHAQSSEPLKTVIPVHFDTATGNITVGSTVYRGTNPGFHLLTLKRQPDNAHLDAPDLIQDQTFLNSSSANQFLQTILAKAPDALLLVNAAGNYGFPLNALAGSLEQFGGQVDLEPIGSAISLVFIGNGGTNKGEARQRGLSTLPLDGYLAADSNGNYRFIQTDYVRYDITMDGTIKIGNQSYTVANSTKPCDGSNSFHMVVVNRESLASAIADRTYCTGQSDAEITRLIGDIGNLVTNEGELVFFASNGHPIPANWNFGTDGDARIYALAVQIAQLGGYWETMAYLTPSDTYSLIGALAPPSFVGGARKRAKESSTVYPSHPTGELHGVLARGRGNWYSPLNADPSGLAELGFYQILAQTPVPFPHPANSAELAAFQYINQQFSEQQGLCNGCNVRDKYADTNVAISNYSDQLNGMKAQDGSDCSESQDASLPFCIVRQQLSTEITYVKNIRAFNTNLTFLWNASATTSILELLSAYNDLSANMPSPATPAPSLLDPIVDLLLGIASYAPGVGDLFGIAEAAFSFGTGLSTDGSGNASTS
ncbi:MAG TPA: hypothetical protein VK604_02805, partial [Bryobacteraceae bacterium]|nr:hypothetical protein [Bryobacteraceae bacterium]